MVAQATKQTLPVKPNDDLNKRSELTAKSTSRAQPIRQITRAETKKIEQSSDKDNSSSDDLNGRFEVSKSTSQAKKVENEAKRASSGQDSVGEVAVKRPVASQAVSSQSSEEDQGSYERSEGRLNSRKPQSGERNGRGQAGQVNGGPWQVSEQISEEHLGGRKKSSSGEQIRSNERSGRGHASSERSGGRSKQRKGGRRY